jgi:hypothetical protein
MESDIQKYLREKVVPLASKINKACMGNPRIDTICALLSLAGMEASLVKDNKEARHAQMMAELSLKSFLELGAESMKEEETDGN